MESSEWRPQHMILKANDLDESDVTEYVKHIRQHLYDLEMAHTLQEYAVEFECIVSDTVAYRNGLQIEIQSRIAPVAMTN